MTTEAMQTKAGAMTTEAQGASKPADQQSATGAEGSGQQQHTEGQDTQGQQGEGGDKKEEGKSEVLGSPEAYEFRAPEGQQYSEPVIGAFSEVAKELDLSQEAAQKILEKMAPVIGQNQLAQVETIQAGWLETSKTDKEIGGDKLEENMAIAKKTFDQYGTPELRELLETTRLGNHPEVIRWAHRVGKALSEDTHVPGTAGKRQQGDARNLYANSNMNP